MSRRSKTQQWFKQHQKDPYVQLAQSQGQRSRACFKLTEIQKKYRFIKHGMTVMDLGAAPGSWAETCVPLVGDKGQVIACDLLHMEAISGVDFIQGDFTEPDVQATMLAKCLGPMQTVICDMSPNHSGIKRVDQWQAHALNELVLAFCNQHLADDGHCLIKVFHSGDFSKLLKCMRKSFRKVHIIKPKASRSQSSEVFVLALGLIARNLVTVE